MCLTMTTENGSRKFAFKPLDDWLRGGAQLPRPVLGVRSSRTLLKRLAKIVSPTSVSFLVDFCRCRTRTQSVLRTWLIGKAYMSTRAKLITRSPPSTRSMTAEYDMSVPADFPEGANHFLGTRIALRIPCIAEAGRVGHASNTAGTASSPRRSFSRTATLQCNAIDTVCVRPHCQSSGSCMGGSMDSLHTTVPRQVVTSRLRHAPSPASAPSKVLCRPVVWAPCKPTTRLPTPEATSMIALTPFSYALGTFFEHLQQVLHR